MAASSEKRMTTRDAMARAAGLLRAGKRAEAATIFRQVLEVEPENADALHLLGIITRQSGKPKEAINLIRRAIALKGENSNFVSNLGTAFEAAGDIEAALAAYRRAIAIEPDYPEPHQKLGALLQTKGRYKEALAPLQRAAELRPEALDWQMSYGNVLVSLGRLQDAAAIFAQIVAKDPKQSEVHFRLGNALFTLKRKDEALASFRRAIEAKPDHDSALFAMTTLLMENRQPQALVDACDGAFKGDPGNRRMISSKIAALHELGRRDEAHALLGMDRFMRPVEIAVPAGHADLNAFNAALAEEVRNHPTLVFEKSGHATKFGGHTGDILINPGPAVAALESAIRAAVADFFREVPSDVTHPWFAAKPAKWKLQSWAVVMDMQGHQMPHIHPAAWLSGVYYVKIPVADPPSRDPQAGWIEFGRPQDNMFATAEPELKLCQPKEGLMILFPSYLFHRTIPIETKEQRISIAFDVLAADSTSRGPY